MGQEVQRACSSVLLTRRVISRVFSFGSYFISFLIMGHCISVFFSWWVLLLMAGQHWMSSGALFLMIYCACSSQLNLVAAVASPCDYSAQICGNLPIPFPFGMSRKCGLSAYRISCKLNPSYGEGLLPFLQVGTASTPELHVVDFSSDTSTIIVNSTQLKAMPTPDNCGKSDGYAEASFELSSSGPFLLSEDNFFAVMGCRSDGSCVASASSSNTSSNASTNYSFTTTLNCSSGCYNQCCFGDFSPDDSYAEHTCFAGFDCCSIPILPGSRILHFNGNGISYPEFPGVCGFSTVLDPNYGQFSTVLDPNFNSYSQIGFPGAGQTSVLSISWALMLSDSENCSTVKNRPDYACSPNADCQYDPRVPGYTCLCPLYFGRGDGYINGTSCWPYADYALLEVLLLSGAGALAGCFILTVLILIIRWARRASRRKQQKKQNFHRNRGEELRSMLFFEDELRKATNNFSREHELGKGGYGTVYWGNLPQHGKVAIKKPKNMEEDADREEDQIRCFVSEILLLGKTTHENVVQLLGCCVETRVPVLVYEFVENGTLWDHLHPSREDAQTSLIGSSWARRLHIAVDTAKALSYLHKMSPPILHRDIKSTNILIDKSYNAKVADFGASRFLTSGATHLTFAQVVGTHGYLDPEYHLSCQFSSKSDVYSFGVILLQLITAMPADLGTKLGLLAYHFQTRFRAGKVTNLIDPRLSTHPNALASIQDVAELAMHCLAMQGHQRPTMEEVLGKLMEIQPKWTAVDEVVELNTQGPSASILHRPIIISQPSAGTNYESEGESYPLRADSHNWSHQSSHQSSAVTTSSEIALASLEIVRAPHKLPATL